MSTSLHDPTRGIASHPLVRDQRGMSVLEYAVVFVGIIVGSVALWSAVGQEVYDELTGGHDGVTQALELASHRQVGGTPGNGGNRSGSAGPAAIPQSSGPGSLQQGNGPAEVTGGPGDPTSLQHSNAPGARAAAQSGRASPGNAGLPPNANPAATATAQSGTVTRARAGNAPPAAMASTVPTSSTRESDVRANSGALRQGESAPAPGNAEDVGFFDQQLDTGGKVGVVAAGAVLGAGLAAGSTVATAYGASLLCGPAAPACAGAVTVGLGAVGVYTLVNGGWDELTGAFGRVFSDEQASVGDALTVGMTIGSVVYGASEAAIGLSRGSAATTAAAEATEVAGATRAATATRAASATEATEGAVAAVARGSTEAAENVKVLGRQVDTAVAKDWPGHDVLDIPDWTLAKNDAWVNSGIASKQNFYLASPTQGNLVQTTGQYAGRPTVFARELEMLLAAGYRQVGDYMVHPANLLKFVP